MDESKIKEELSIAYLSALCAAGGMKDMYSIDYNELI